MDEHGRLLRHGIHHIDGPFQGVVDVRIGVLGKSDMGIADLHEQRLSESRRVGLRGRRDGKVNRRQHTAA
jgi:hypothetical protein